MSPLSKKQVSCDDSTVNISEDNVILVKCCSNLFRAQEPGTKIKHASWNWDQFYFLLPTSKKEFVPVNECTYQLLFISNPVSK